MLVQQRAAPTLVCVSKSQVWKHVSADRDVLPEHSHTPHAGASLRSLEFIPEPPGGFKPRHGVYHAMPGLRDARASENRVFREAGILAHCWQRQIGIHAFQVRLGAANSGQKITRVELCEMVI